MRNLVKYQIYLLTGLNIGLYATYPTNAQMATLIAKKEFIELY